MKAYQLNEFGQTRTVWQRSRSCDENDMCTKGNGVAGFSLGRYSHVLDPVIEFSLKISGLFERGVRNASAVQLVEYNLALPTLPQAFDGFTILFMSDLHLDGPIDVCENIAKILPDEPVDICLLGGDYHYGFPSRPNSLGLEFKQLLDKVQTCLGFFAVLGNHDGLQTVTRLEELGVVVLANQVWAVEHEGSRIVLCGTDDPHRFYSSAAVNLLGDAPDDFSIALIHTVELASEAADAGFDLYLAGHSHGGQLCLPRGKALLTGLHCHRDFYLGLWHLQNMQGYTSAGAGVVGVPVRYNCPPDITLLTLRSGPKKA